MNALPFPSLRDIEAAPRRRIAMGYALAIVAVLITSTYPALTRLSVTSSLTPGDLLAFRFGIAALVFAPLLVMRFRRVTRDEWRLALPLSFCQGWGMAALVVFGLQFGPASHAAALGPGAIGAWVAIIAFAFYGVRVSSRKLVGLVGIVCGVALLVVASYRGLSVERAMTGDAMFLAASALGAIYLINVERHRLDPVLSAALVCMASAIIIVPWQVFVGASSVASAPLHEIVWQMLFQGVIFGAFALVTVNGAIRLIGSQNVGVVTAMVPVIGGFCSSMIAGDPISNAEWAGIGTISLGVAAASIAPRMRARARIRLSPRMTHSMSGQTRAG